MGIIVRAGPRIGPNNGPTTGPGPSGAAGNSGGTAAQSTSIPEVAPNTPPWVDPRARDVRRDRDGNPIIWIPGVGADGKDKLTTVPIANTTTSIYRDKADKDDCANRLKKHGVGRHGEVKNRQPKTGPSHHFFQNAYLQPNKNRGPGQSRDGVDKPGHVCPAYHEDDGIAIQLKTTEHQAIDRMQMDTNQVLCAASKARNLPLTFEQALAGTAVQLQAIGKLKKMDQKDMACIMLATVAAIAAKCPQVIDGTTKLRIPGC